MCREQRRQNPSFLLSLLEVPDSETNLRTSVPCVDSLLFLVRSVSLLAYEIADCACLLSRLLLAAFAFLHPLSPTTPAVSERVREWMASVLVLIAPASRMGGNFVVA